MAVNNWVLNAGGSWGTAADWSLGILPTDLDMVNIDLPGITVTVDTGVVADAYSLMTQSADLSVTGGTLYTVHLATFDGGYSQNAGTYTAGGQGAVFNGSVSMTGGLLDVTTGALKLNDGGSLSGTLGGAGVLELAGGSTYIYKGFVSKLGSILVDPGAKLGFNTSFTYARNITVQSGVLNLFGNTLVLSGTTLLSGTAAGGVINESGTLTLGTNIYQTSLDDGLQLNLSGTATQTNILALGAADSGAKISVSKSGHYAINGNWDITNPSNVGSISNAGVFAKTGGGKVSSVYTSFTSTGTLQVNVGELRLNGLVNSLSGTVSGAGTLGIGLLGSNTGGQTTLGKLSLSVAAVNLQAGNVLLNGSLSYGGEWDMNGGVLDLNERGAVLTLSGRDDFDGGVVTGYGGTLNLNGATEIGNGVTFGGPGKIKIAGTVDQTSTINFGPSSNPEADIAATAKWLIEGDGSIIGTYGLINNLGLFSDVNGSGDSIVQCEVGSSGTVNATNSTLTLAGGNVLGGTLSGTGLIDLAGATTLQAGLAIRVAALDVSSLLVLGGNLSDAGIFTEYLSGLIDTAGHTLALSGSVSLDAGGLTDEGVVSSAGQTTVGAYSVTGGAELLISGHADQTGALSLDSLSGAGTLGITAGGIYTVLDDFDITGAGTVSVSGSLAESGTGSANIGAAIVLATGGHLVANDQTLNLTDGGSLAGSLAGAGNIDLDGGTFTLAAGLSALSAGLQIGSGVAVLSANQTYGGTFIDSPGATVSLGGDTLSLTGTSLLSGIITGPGVLLASGATTLGAASVTAAGTLHVTGPTEQMFNLQLGDPPGAASTASLIVGGAYTLDNNALILGDGTLTVTGTLSATGDGTSQIAPAIVDSGAIAANLGTLQIMGAVSGSGSFSIGASGNLDFSNASTIGIATTVAFAGAGGTLRIDDLANFGATLQGFGGSNDMIQISGLDGASITGTYANAAHTQILVSDAQSHSITLNFASAQNLSSITFTAGVGDVALLIHH